MTTELRGKSAIVGTGHAGFGEAHGLTAYDVMAQSALAALGVSCGETLFVRRLLRGCFSLLEPAFKRRDGLLQGR